MFYTVKEIEIYSRIFIHSYNFIGYSILRTGHSEERFILKIIIAFFL